MYKLSTTALLGLAIMVTPVMAEPRAEKQVKSALQSNLANAAERAAEDTLRGLSDNLEVTMSGFDKGKPAFSILKVMPLVDDLQAGRTIFLQGSISSVDERDTGNIGIGYRKLIADNTMIIGVNGFYDNEWSFDHERASIGFELLSSVGDIRINNYTALSDTQDGKDGVSETALDGFDAELSLPLPYLPLTKIHAKAFKFDGNDTNTEIEGNTASLRSALPYGFTLEAGTTSYDDDDTADQDFISLSLNMALGRDAASWSPNLVSQHAYELRPIEDRRLEKVRRTNTITKERGGAFVVLVTGV